MLNQFIELSHQLSSVEVSSNTWAFEDSALPIFNNAFFSFFFFFLLFSLNRLNKNASQIESDFFKFILENFEKSRVLETSNSNKRRI